MFDGIDMTFGMAWAGSRGSMAANTDSSLRGAIGSATLSLAAMGASIFVTLCGSTCAAVARLVTIEVCLAGMAATSVLLDTAAGDGTSVTNAIQPPTTARSNAVTTQ